MAAYNAAGRRELILTAGLLTFGMTAALTLYACVTKTDMTVYGGILFCCLIGLLFLAILAAISHLKFLHIALCVLTIIIYGIYLVYDTQLIVGGRKYQLSLDDYIIGALILYVDIITLFLELLRLLSYLEK